MWRLQIAGAPTSSQMGYVLILWLVESTNPFSFRIRMKTSPRITFRNVLVGVIVAAPVSKPYSVLSASWRTANLDTGN